MVGNRIRKDTNERMAGVKIIQNAPPQRGPAMTGQSLSQNSKLQVKNFFALLFSFIRQLAD